VLVVAQQEKLGAIIPIISALSTALTIAYRPQAGSYFDFLSSFSKSD
jgi:hypothetical protein